MSASADKRRCRRPEEGNHEARMWMVCYARLAGALLVAALVLGCDDAVETEGAVLFDGADLYGSADAPPSDTGAGADTQTADTAPSALDAVSRPDAAVSDGASGLDVAGTMCLDCMCQCGDGRFIPYGGCFGPGDEIPAEIERCSADCAAVCAVACPDIDCFGLWCPSGYWPGLDGCSTCACAPPPVRLEINGESRNATHVALQTTPTLYIGGLNRLVLDLAWAHDNPAWADEEETVTTTLRLVMMDWEPGPEMRTFYWPSASNSVLEVYAVTYTQQGVGLVEHAMIVQRAMVTVRRDGDRLQGGVHLQLVPAVGEWPATLVAAGSFDVAMPS